MINSLITVCYANNTERDKIAYDLLLAGGGLKTCSSMSPKNCTKNSFSESALEKIVYQLSQANLLKFKGTSAFKHMSEQSRKNIDSILTDIYAKLPDIVVDRSGLRELFELTNSLKLYRQMPDDLFYALLDSLEYRQLDQLGQRKQEQTALKATRNLSSIEIYRTFVEQAAMRMPADQSRPKIAVITASSRDPFESADFYLSVLTQAGGDVVWLPIDKTYQQAQELNQQGFDGCSNLEALRAKNLSFYRSSIYPNRVEKQQKYCQNPALLSNQLKQLQGVFFNGGDQSLTLAALKNSDGSDSQALAVIRQQMSSGALIVGGTSAGTAVQAGNGFDGKPIPMISNGDSQQAMGRGPFAISPPSTRCATNKNCGVSLQADDLTFKASGGTGLFELGLLDTHFSERDRETRLAMFVAHSQQTFGFGVDETSAMLSRYDIESETTQLKIIGQNGVYIADFRQGKLTRVHEPFSVTLSAMSHYLNAGTTAVYSHKKAQWAFSVAGQALTSIHKLKALDMGEWRDFVRRKCGTTKQISWRQFDNQYQLSATDSTRFYHNSLTDHCSYTHLNFTIKH